MYNCITFDRPISNCSSALLGRWQCQMFFSSTLRVFIHLLQVYLSKYIVEQVFRYASVSWRSLEVFALASVLPHPNLNCHCLNIVLVVLLWPWPQQICLDYIPDQNSNSLLQSCWVSGTSDVPTHRFSGRMRHWWLLGSPNSNGVWIQVDIILDRLRMAGAPGGGAP